MQQTDLPAGEKQLALLFEVSRSLNELIDLDRLLPFIITKTRELLNAESSAVLLLDEERQELYFPFVADASREVEKRLNEIRFPADRGIAGWVVQNGIPQLVPDVTKDPRWYPDVDKQTGMSTRSILSVPLRGRYRIMGVVQMRNKIGGVFTKSDLDFLTALAGSIANAIENAELYGKLKRSEAMLRDELILLHREMRERQRAEEARRQEAAMSAALARVGRELISCLGGPALLERLCQVTTAVLDCPRSHTLICEEREEAFRPLAAYGTSPEEQEVLRVLSIPSSLMARTLERLGNEDVTVADPAAADSSWLEPFGSGLKLCMALRRGEEIIGVHIAGFGERAAQVTPLQQRIAKGIAQLASMALANARLLEELERANRLKSDFVAAMSHELRTPLHIMMGYNGLLLEKQFGPLSPQQVDTLKRIQKNAKDLLGLINATLDLSRLEAGRAPLDVRPVSLPSLFAEIRADAANLTQKPNVDTEWRIDPNIPEVYTDAVKLKVLVMNLLDNAMKFTPQGKVCVAVQQADTGVELSVSDTGIGITPQIMPIIFEAFRQGESAATRRFGGVGLGLYVVRKLLDLLGGKIEVDSVAGKGSTFRVWLPQSIARDE